MEEHDIIRIDGYPGDLVLGQCRLSRHGQDHLLIADFDPAALVSSDEMATQDSALSELQVARPVDSQVFRTDRQSDASSTCGLARHNKPTECRFD